MADEAKGDAEAEARRGGGEGAGDAGEEASMRFHAHVGGKTITVAAGGGAQPVRWLGSVAVARWDDANCRGWLQLGVVTKATRLAGDGGGGGGDGGGEAGTPLELTDVLNEVLEDGDHVAFETSIEAPPVRSTGGAGGAAAAET